MQHGGSCGVAPTILLASITLIIANLLRWAAASWIAQLKKRMKESETRQLCRGRQCPKWTRRSMVAKRYTLGKIARPTAIDRFSSRLAVTRCVYPFVECSEATTRESQCSGPSSVKDAVTWRTIFSTYVFNTKIFHRLFHSFVWYRVKRNAAKECRIILNVFGNTVERSPKGHLLHLCFLYN